MSNTLSGYINLGRNNNLSAFLAGIPGLETANVCTSAKGAKELCAFWNACRLAKGTLWE